MPADGSIDCHAHIIDPQRFAWVEGAGYRPQPHETGTPEEAVIAWLREMEAENPFRLGGCGHDFPHGRFVGPIKDAEALAARMIEFCPDIADQAHASVRRLSRAGQAKAKAQEMTTTAWFGFWWD